MATKDQLAPTQDLEALRASVDQFQQAAIDIDQRKRTLLEDQLQLSRTLLGLREEREKQLRAMLDERGLGICAWGKHPKQAQGYSYTGSKGMPHIDKDGDELKTEGVFSLSEMSMYFKREVTQGPIYGEDDDIEVHGEFVLLCPGHAGSVTDSYKKESHYNYGGHNFGYDMESMVVLTDGKFIREVDGQEVKSNLQTDVPSERVYELLRFPQLPSRQ